MAVEQRYSVVFAGELVDGHEAAQVQAALVARFKMDPTRIARLFAGSPVTLRRNLPLAQANALCEAFRAAGALCRLSAEATAAGPTTPSSAEHAVSATLAPVTASRGTLALRRLRMVAGLALPMLYPTAMVVLAGLGVARLLRPLLQPRDLFSVVFVDVLPGLLLLALLLWLLRPLLHRAPSRAQVRLVPEQAPQLHGIAAQLAEQLAIPPAAALVLDDSLRVRARWRFRQRQWTLHVGLPLLAALDTRQIAGLMAQTLQSSAPANAPVLLQLVEDAIAWLQRCAARQDRLDQHLAELGADLHGGRAALAQNLLRLLRLPHRLLGWLGRCSALLANPLLRRRELDALQAQLRMAGGAASAAVLERRARLERARDELRRDLHEGELELLCADLPGLVTWLADQRAADWQAEIETTLDDPKRRLRGVSDAERLALARDAGAAVGFSSQAPARELLADYAALARQLSLKHYRRLSVRAAPETLLPLAQARAELLAGDERARALREYFRGYWLPGQVVVPHGLAEARALEAEERIRRLRELVDQVRSVVPELSRLNYEYPRRAQALLDAQLAAACARYRSDPEAEHRLAQCKQEFAKQEAELRRYVQVLGERFALGLAEAVHLAHEHKTKLAVEAKVATAALAGLAELGPVLESARYEARLLCRLQALRAEGARIPEQALLATSSKLWHRHDEVYRLLGGIALQRGSLLERMRAVLPALSARARAAAVSRHLERLESLLERVRQRQIGRLAQLAGGAEEHHGIRIRVLE